MIKLSLLLSLTILTSCSSIQFISQNRVSTTFDFSDDKNSDVSIEVNKTFYMWGLYPEVQVVEVDDVFGEKGFNSISDLSIKEINTINKGLWMFFTFGMYYPQTYMLTAKAK